MEAWDIRRHMIRVFGFGGFDTDLMECTWWTEIEHPAREGRRGSTAIATWTVVYRMAVRCR
jgi:hypothetical protein